MPLFDANLLIYRMLLLIPLWLSLSVHEWAHAWTAFKLGDDTAALMGRLTLNPLAHIDPFGTILLPLLGIPFGWAKPVPVQPHRFRRSVNMRTGMMITAVAGPISNLCLAAIFIACVVVLAHFRPDVFRGPHPAAHLLLTMVFLNVALAVFNILPIPPLDGSRVADALMPAPLRPAWEAFCQLGPMALLAVIVLPQLMGFSLFAWPQKITVALIEQLMRLFGN